MQFVVCVFWQWCHQHFHLYNDAFVRVQVFETLIPCVCAILFGWFESLWCFVRWFRCSEVVVFGVCLEVESQ